MIGLAAYAYHNGSLYGVVVVPQLSVAIIVLGRFIFLLVPWIVVILYNESCSPFFIFEFVLVLWRVFHSSVAVVQVKKIGVFLVFTSLSFFWFCSLSSVGIQKKQKYKTQQHTQIHIHSSLSLSLFFFSSSHSFTLSDWYCCCSIHCWNSCSCWRM
jgi:hypothetical protein